MKPRLRTVVVVRTGNYVLSRTRFRATRYPWWTSDRHFLYLVEGWDFDEYCASIRATSLCYEDIEPAGHAHGLRLHDDMIIPPGDSASVGDPELIAFVSDRFNCEAVQVCRSVEEVDHAGPDAFDRSEVRLPVLSVGGWCGPAMCLRMLGIHHTAGPFDSSYSSMASVIDALEGRARAYLPTEPPVKQQMSFRRIDKAMRLGLCPTLAHASRGSIFSHHDFEADPQMYDRMLERVRRMVDFLSTHRGEVVFIRGATNPEWPVEKSRAVEFLDMLERRYPDLRPTLVLILHDQHVGTVRIDTFDSRIESWCVHGFVNGAPPSLNGYDDIIIEEYCRTVLASLRGRNSGQPPDLKRHTVRGHDEHWIF